MGRRTRMRAQASTRARDLHAASKRELLAAGSPLTDPKVQALIAEAFDFECQQYLDRDRALQEARLRGRRWKQVEEVRDGIGHWVHRGHNLALIHSIARHEGEVWGHVSVSNRANTMPTWHEVRDAGWLLYPRLYGLIVVAPESMHVNISNVAHVWYCLTAKPVPDFTHGYGSI